MVCVAPSQDHYDGFLLSVCNRAGPFVIEM
jgi:hypothetical protein